MGIYDREYYQGENAPRGFQLGGQRMMVTNIVLFTVAVFLIDTFASGRLSELLRLDLVFYRRPWQVYQVLSYGFVHGGVWHVALNMFMLWMFGRPVEERLGRREFVGFYLAAVVCAGLMWALWQNATLLSTEAGRAALQRLPADNLPHVVGASGGVVAVFIMFVLYYPKQTVYLWGLFGMPAWIIGALVIGWDVVAAAMGESGRTAWQAHLGGAAFAFLYLKLGLNFSRWLPSSGGRGWRLPGRSPKLRIHKPSDDDDNLAAEADRILAKMHREGEQSLTGRERRTLEKYSRRVRDRRERES